MKITYMANIADTAHVTYMTVKTYMDDMEDMADKADLADMAGIADMAKTCQKKLAHHAHCVQKVWSISKKHIFCIVATLIFHLFI